MQIQFRTRASQNRFQSGGGFQTAKSGEVKAKPRSRPDGSKTQSTDRSVLSREARMEAADKRREAAWKKFNNPKVLRRAFLKEDRHYIEKFRAQARKLAKEAGPEGSKAYRDVYRREFANRILPYVAGSGDVTDSKERRSTLKHGDAFENADRAYRELKEQSKAPTRREPELKPTQRRRTERTPAQKKELIDGLFKNFESLFGN
jgi:hypothetical protein